MEGLVCSCEPSSSPIDPERGHRIDVPEGDVIGDRSLFCTMFFHCQKAYEFGIGHPTCVSDKSKCVQSTRAVVARLTRADTGTPVVTKVYSNCLPNKGSPVHAEEMLVTDPDLDKVLGQRHDYLLTLYMKYQPCHHSRKSNDPRSCSRLLAHWMQKRKNVKLVIRVSNIYMAAWTVQNKDRLAKHVDKARNGISLLVQHEIKVDKIDLEGWGFLCSLFSDTQVISRQEWNNRFYLDKKIGDFLASLPVSKNNLYARPIVMRTTTIKN